MQKWSHWILWVVDNLFKIVDFFITCQCKQIPDLWDPSYICLKHFEYQLQKLDINKTLKFQPKPIKVKKSRVKVDPAPWTLFSCMYAWVMGRGPGCCSNQSSCITRKCNWISVWSIYIPCSGEPHALYHPYPLSGPSF